MPENRKICEEKQLMKLVQVQHEPDYVKDDCHICNNKMKSLEHSIESDEFTYITCIT